MFKFYYGKFSINWIFEEANIKTHTITVSKDKPVLLKGRKLPFPELENLIKKKARWIKSKTESMKSISTDDIVSGSRLKYLGRTYMVIIELSETEIGATVTFNARQFHIVVNSKVKDRQELIKFGLDQFYRKATLGKIYPKFKYLEKETGLKGCGYRINSLQSSWGRCSPEGLVEINQKCIELSSKIIDYIIVHELCHTVELNHTKEFWKLVSLHYPNWEECHKKLDGDI